MHIIIPMSGIGKRFIDAGYTVPKPLIEIEGKPMIQHVIELFPGETKFTFICNDLHLNTTNMREFLEKYGNIVSVSVNNRKGPVDAVLQAHNCIDDNEEVIISYCDYGTKWNYTEFKNQFKQVDGSIACYRGFHPHMLGSDNYAFVKLDENERMEKIQEKKPFTNCKMDEYASNGTYYFKNGAMIKRYFRELVDKNISINDEFYVSMVYNLMKQDNLTIGIFEIDKMLQWGTPYDLEEYLVWSNYFLHRNNPFLSMQNDKYSTTLILPMAGAGSRFYNMGFQIPKPLLPIEGESMVIRAVECLPPVTNRIFICQNSHLNNYPIAGKIKQKYENSTIIGIDGVTGGQACTCELALNHINPETHLMISACDNGVYYDEEEYNELLEDDNVDIIIWSFSNNATSKLYPHMYAWLDIDSTGMIKRVSMKKPFEDIDNKYAIIGTMLFKKARFFQEGLSEIYSKNLRTNGEFYVDNMIEPLIQKGYKCRIFNVKNYLCWGTPNDYKTYNYWFDYFREM